MNKTDYEAAFKEWKILSKVLSEVLINDGCKENKVDFDNGFTVILRDRKSASFRSKQRSTKDRNCLS